MINSQTKLYSFFYFFFWFIQKAGFGFVKIDKA